MKEKFPHLYFLFKRLLLVYLIFTLLRFIFLIFNWNTFSNISSQQLFKAFQIGLLFDTSAISYIFGIVILMHVLPISFRSNKHYQYVLKWVFICGVFFSVLLNLIDVGYFPFIGKRSGVELFKMQSTQNASLLIYVFSYWYLFVILIALLLLTWYLYPSFSNKGEGNNNPNWLIETLVFIVVCVLTFFGARGSFGLKPLNTMDAATYVNPILTPLTVNTPFAIFLSLDQSGLEEKKYYSSNVINALNLTQHITDNNSTNIGKNVVLIIVESLGKEYVSGYNNKKGFTPFIDSLMQVSTVYTNAYANSKRSIEGIPAIISAMPSWMSGDYINSFYQTNTLHSLGYYLTKQGYDCSFYHGGKNGTMNFDKFVAQTEFGKYYGLNEYPKQEDFDGNWGIPDEPYLQYWANELNTKKEPFMSTVFTLSSHHPYTLPITVKDKFKGGSLPIHATIEYVDFALQQFFEKAKKQPWFANTVFILTSDHSSENIEPYYQTMQGRYAVPLLIYNPNESKFKTIEKTTDQLQIMSIILNEVSKPSMKYFSFANDYAIQYTGGVYQLINYPYVLHFDGEKNIGFYNITTDSLMETNLLNSPEIAQIKDSLSYSLKGIIQNYNYRLIKNQTN